MITFWGKNHCSTKSSIKDHPSDESGFLKSGIPLPGPPIVLRVTAIPIWGASGWEKRCLRCRAQNCLIDFSLSLKYTAQVTQNYSAKQIPFIFLYSQDTGKVLGWQLGPLEFQSTNRRNEKQPVSKFFLRNLSEQI